MPFLFLLQDYSDVGNLILRLGLAAIFWTHGRAKKGTWKMQPSEQMPAPMLKIMRLLSVCEPLGAIAMVLGFLTQPAALGFAVIMLGAINMKRKMMKVPFVFPDMKAGWEFDFINLAAALALIFLGPGAYSLDRILSLA
jgi:uncharacterized membrane protein YphA (DoxX/SURF4 family)